MKREEALKRVNEYYSQLLASGSKALAQREMEIRSRFPEIDALLIKRAQLPLLLMRQAAADKDSRIAAAERMKTEGPRMNAEIRSALRAAGYPENYLSMQYNCALCKDTGYLPVLPAEMCECCKRKLSEYLREGDGVSDYARQNFGMFDENRIPADEIAPGLTQRAFTVRIKEACEDYADSFPSPIKPNMLLSGPAGVGKTFLLNCIADRVEEKGYDVTIITAYRLLEAMRSKHFHTDEGLSEFDALLSCRLLLIDDLGSEPVLRNISREYLGLLINERMLRKLNTVISCNLTRQQICDIYDERIMSRLCDREQWDFITLKGRDIRRYDPSKG